MATSNNSSNNIIPLNGSNYATWKIQCMMALKKENLWGIVSGTEIEPVQAAEGENNNLRAKYFLRRDKAVAIIVLAVDTSLLYLLGEPDNPKTVWDKLSDQFQKKSWANKLTLRRRLYSMRLAVGGSVDEHIKAMLEIFNELAVIGDPVMEEDRVIHLLASLPDSFDMLVTALEALADVPAMEIVIERLRHEERKINDRSGGMHEKALASRGGKGPKCYHCKRFGHIKRNCPELETNMSSTRPGKFKACKACSKQDISSDDDVALLVQHALSTSVSAKNWIVDSGATTHMCNDRKLFKMFRDSDPMHVTLGDGHDLEAMGVGDVGLEMKLSNGKTQKCTLTSVLYVPDLAYNLFSVSKASEAGMTAVFGDRGCRIKTADGKIIGAANHTGSLYYLDCISRHEFHVAEIDKHTIEDSWHQRYGHLSENALRKLAKDKLVDGFTYDPSKNLNFCEPCTQGKIHRNKFSNDGGKRSTQILGLIHSDVCGKLSSASLGGAQYFLTFIDDKTRYTWVYFLKSKEQVFDKFLEWKVKVERSSGQKVKILRSDNGGEYISKKFEAHLKKEGIRHEVTIPKTPEQNGVAERMNRTLVEMTRSMLSDMPRKFWAEALSTAVFLRNRSPTTAVPGMTPYEAMMGERPDVANLKTFGCTCYAHIPKDERKKLDPKSRKCLFLGYGDCVKGYRLYDINRSKVIHCRDVIFNECSFDDIKKSDVTSTPSGMEEIEVIAPDVNEQQDEEIEVTVQDEDEQEMAEDFEKQRSERIRRAPVRYGEWVTIADIKDPTSYKEAISKDKVKWQAAIDAELDSLEKNNVWDLVPLPEGRKVIGCKWVFKTKVSPDGTIDRHKARLVAQGYSQKYGLDYDETFCPVVRTESVRSVIALAAKKNLLLHQMDVTTAFLNGTLEEDVYMRQPEGFVKKGKEHLVCKLKKSLYGLKQSPRCWNTTLDQHFRDMNLKQSNADPCTYISDGKETVIVAVHVDDFIIATENEETMKAIKKLISEKFEVKDLGELKSFLGVHVKMIHEGIWIGQPTYVSSILDKFGMTNSKPVSTPVDSSQKLSFESNQPPVDEILYQSAVGSLLYLSNWTRPDITYAVNTVAKFSSRPTEEHWTGVKRIMRYLRGTSDYGIMYTKDHESVLTGHCDADWAGDVSDRKSTSGYVFSLAGAPVSWRSKKQTCVALSTAEAEYMSLASSTQEAIWLHELMNQLDEPSTEAMVIYSDSQSAIAMAKNPQFHGRSKHIDIKYHFIRGKIADGTVKLLYCPTENMQADILTKGLSKEKHNKFCRLMNICNV